MTRGALKFVVVASPKSGTTWVQRLISAHPAMHCGESRLFGRYYDPSNPTGPHTTIEQTTRHLLRHLSPPDVGEDFGEKLAFGLVDTIAGLCALRRRRSRSGARSPSGANGVWPQFGSDLGR